MKSKRDKILLIATLAIVVIGVSYHLMGDSLGSESFSMGGGDLETARAEFQKNIAALRKSSSIEHEYRAIAFGLPEQTKGKDPGLTFMTQLNDLLLEQLGRAPHVGNPDYNQIPNVNDYYYVDCKVDTEGTYAEMTKLLQDMERLGLLIKEFTLDQGGSSGGFQHEQSENVKLTAIVSRLVKYDKKMRKQMERRGHRG